MIGPSGINVPKAYADYPAEVAWAFRYGVVCAMRSTGRVLHMQKGGYVTAPRTLLRIADKVRIQWLRRHGHLPPVLNPAPGLAAQLGTARTDVGAS